MSIAGLKELKHLPGDHGLPFFGHLFDYMADATAFYKKRKTKYGDVYKVHTVFGTSVVLSGPSANRFILIENAKHTSNREAWEMALSDLFPNGLMLMDGERHKYHRSIMNEAFKKEPIQGYLDVMPEIIQTALDEINGKRKVLFFPFMKSLTLKLAGKVFFGIEREDDLHELNKAISDVVNAALALPINFPGTKYRKGLKGRERLVLYFKSIIEQRRSAEGIDLFSRLCQARSENGDQFTDQEIIDHMIFVLMASHDTTAITLSLMSYFLAKYPDWQSKVRDETYNLFDRGVTIETLRSYHQTGIVMKETLRLHPPLITVVRKLEKQLTIEKHVLPKNTVVNIVFQSTHLDERVWDQPEDFNPLRFQKRLSEHLRCPYAYAPFGAGQHHCIGFAFAEYQIKMVIAALLRKYKLSIPENYECPIADLPLKHPKDQLPIFLHAI